MKSVKKICIGWSNYLLISVLHLLQVGGFDEEEESTLLVTASCRTRVTGSGWKDRLCVICYMSKR